MALHWTQVVNCALFVYVLLQFQTSAVCGKRLHEKIYESFFGGSCFRRLNGTHQTGCSSAESGSVGALHYVYDNNQLEFLLNSPPAPPYAAILKSDFFTRQNMMRLKHEGGRNITAVIVLNAFNNFTEDTAGFSHELKCPNQYSGILIPNTLETATCSALRPEDTWNPWGSGLLHEDFPFPIILIPDNETVTKLIDCFQKFNSFDYESQHLRSLCAVEIKSFMSAAVSTEVCWRRSNFINNLAQTRYCDPLEGKNIYATLFPRKIVEIEEGARRIAQVDREEKFILVTTRLDTTGMFEGVYGVGAMDSLTGYTILVSVAHTLSRLLTEKSQLKNPKRNILFMIFNGESYDYIGSQRLVYDLEHMYFPKPSTYTAPITFENIEFVLDLGTFDETSTIKLHSLSEFPFAKTILAKLQQYSAAPKYDFKIKFENSIGFQMPPTSAQSFLRKNISFPAAILNAPPTNRFYHSVYDDGANLKFNYTNSTLDYTKLMGSNEALKYFKADGAQMKMRNVSAVIAMSLYEVLTGREYVDDLLPSPVLIDEILYCFIKSQNCPLFFAASKPNSFTKLPLIAPNRYISVNRDSQEATIWTYRIMGYLMSQKLTNVTEEENCTYLPRYWFAGYNKQGECGLTTQNYSLALSPAFIIENYNWTSGDYSTWSESTWSSLSSRLFLRPSRTHEIITLTTGIVVFVLSFCLIYIISTRSEVLFEDPGPNASTDALNPPTAC